MLYNRSRLQRVFFGNGSWCSIVKKQHKRVTKEIKHEDGRVEFKESYKWVFWFFPTERFRRAHKLPLARTFKKSFPEYDKNGNKLVEVLSDDPVMGSIIVKTTFYGNETAFTNEKRNKKEIIAKNNMIIDTLKTKLVGADEAKESALARRKRDTQKTREIMEDYGQKPKKPMEE